MPYRLNHPASDHEIEVEADAVPTYLSQGWKAKPTANPPKSDED